MAFPLHKAPRGLLELLRLRTLGNQPDQFSEQLVPVVAASDFYGLDLQFSGASAASVGAFPRLFTETITAGPNRYKAIALSLVLGAAGGTFVVGWIGVRHPGSGGIARLHTFASAIAPATRELAFGGSLPGEGLLLAPGAQLVGFVDSDAAGADHTAALTFLLQALSTG